MFVIFLFLFTITGCQEKAAYIGKLAYGEYFIRGDIRILNNDTILNGPIKYFDSSNRLIAVFTYKDNLKLGKAIRYQNEKIVQETNFYFDYENGLKLDYDSTGELVAKSNYFFDRQVGPRTNYSNGDPYYFRFVNFDQQILYECKYNKGAIEKEKGSVLHYTTDYVEEEGINKLQIFIYVIEPPYSKISYKLYDVNLGTETGQLVHEFISTNGYVQNVIIEPPKKNHKYILRTDLFFERDNITKQNEAELVLPKSMNDQDNLKQSPLEK